MGSQALTGYVKKSSSIRLINLNETSTAGFTEIIISFWVSCVNSRST